MTSYIWGTTRGLVIRKDRPLRPQSFTSQLYSFVCHIVNLLRHYFVQLLLCWATTLQYYVESLALAWRWLIFCLVSHHSHANSRDKGYRWKLATARSKTSGSVRNSRQKMGWHWWAAVMQAASSRLFAKRHIVFYTTVFLLPQLRTGPSWTTWSSGHAFCEDSRSAVWKQSGIMMWDNRKEPWTVPGLGRREGGCGVED